jgi:hydroxypyruvate reductase
MSSEKKQDRALKELVQEIFHSAMADVKIGPAFRRKVRREGSLLRFGEGKKEGSVDLASFEKIWVASFGKAGWATYDALQEMLGEDFTPQRGVIVSNVPARQVPKGFEVFRGGHPVPNLQSFAAAEAILEMLREADEKTLVFFFISGGGSSLVEKPLEPGVTLKDMKEFNKLLVECGASIDRINAVRKHLSAIKGGRLREVAGEAHSVTFILSDVPEGMAGATSSGPTVPDPSTVAECYEMVVQFGLLDKLPRSIRGLFQNHRLPETPKKGAEVFQRGQSFVLLSNADILEAARREAEGRGFVVEQENRCNEWPLERARKLLLERLEEVISKNPGQPVALLSGGEVLVEVTGDGRGGRNLAFVLSCVERIAGREIVVFSAGTDGIDGNSAAAGAVADGGTLARAQKKKLDPDDYFERSDSFHFFEALGDAIVTGPQQNNLRDLRLLLAR